MKNNIFEKEKLNFFKFYIKLLWKEKNSKEKKFWNKKFNRNKQYENAWNGNDAQIRTNSLPQKVIIIYIKFYERK